MKTVAVEIGWAPTIDVRDMLDERYVDTLFLNETESIHGLYQFDAPSSPRSGSASGPRWKRPERLSTRRPGMRGRGPSVRSPPSRPPNWDGARRVRNERRGNPANRGGRETLRRRAGGRRREPGGRARRILRVAGAQRVGQDDAAPHRLRAGGARPGPGGDRRRRRDRASALPAPHRHGVPGFPAVSAPHGGGEHHLSPQDAGPESGRAERAARLDSRLHPHGGARRAVSPPALRRPEAARRPRPRTDRAPRAAAARRAAGQPRPRASQGDGSRGAALPGGARHPLRVRDAQPGRGPDHERPHGGDEWRRPGAGGSEARGLQRAGHAVRGLLRRRAQPARGACGRRRGGAPAHRLEGHHADGTPRERRSPGRCGGDVPQERAHRHRLRGGRRRHT